MTSTDMNNNSAGKLMRVHEWVDKEFGYDLDRFVEIMCTKLYDNRHKKTIDEADVPRIVELLCGEIGEFVRQYMEDKKDPNAKLELADIANFAFLIFQALRK